MKLDALFGSLGTGTSTGTKRQKVAASDEGEVQQLLVLREQQLRGQEDTEQEQEHENKDREQGYEDKNKKKEQTAQREQEYEESAF